MEKCGEFTRNRARRDEVTHCIVEPYKSAAMALVAFSLSFKVKTVKTAEKYYQIPKTMYCTILG